MEMKLKWVKDEERVGLGNVSTVGSGQARPDSRRFLTYHVSTLHHKRRTLKYNSGANLTPTTV